MALGLAIGVFFPQASVSLNELSVDNVNIPIAIGLVLMMYPPLAKWTMRFYQKYLRIRKP